MDGSKPANEMDSKVADFLAVSISLLNLTNITKDVEASPRGYVG